MSYTKRDDIPVLPGETAIQLDSGELAAVKCDRTTVTGAVVFTATARAINSEGVEVLDADGVSIARVLKHQDPIPGRADAIARDCLLAVLGEPPQLVEWGEQYLRDVSIRQALALANIPPGAVDAAAVL